MQDKIETINGSAIYHGPYNDRVYLMKLGQENPEKTIELIEELAEERGYGKIFVKVPAEFKELFKSRGYLVEALVPKMYNGRRDAAFLARFPDQKRRLPADPGLLREVIETTRKKHHQPPEPLARNFSFRIAESRDVPGIVEVYKRVFASYPFPIFDPSYIEKTMQENIIYFCIYHGDSLAAVSSVEMDLSGKNVEMTDFATLPKFRGNRFAQFLLGKMELEVRKRGLLTAYTIARAVSFGMNVTFKKAGYFFAGTLINNTNISGSTESMNVWYKPLLGAGHP